MLLDNLQKETAKTMTATYGKPDGKVFIDTMGVLYEQDASAVNADITLLGKGKIATDVVNLLLANGFSLSGVHFIEKVELFSYSLLRNSTTGAKSVS